MNITEATDEMFAHVVTATPPGVEQVWEGVSSNIPTNTPWIRPCVRHGTSRQSGFTPTHVRRFKEQGFLFIQCFGLIGDGQLSASDLSIAFTSYFKALRDSSIWYSNIVANEVGKDGGYTEYKVSIQFEYDNFT